MKKNRFSAIFAALALLLTTSCATSAPDNWVKIKGNQFIDPQGQELIFRGLCFSDPVKLISDWDFTPTTQGRFFKPYLQGKAKGE